MLGLLGLSSALSLLFPLVLIRMPLTAVLTLVGKKNFQNQYTDFPV